MSKFVLYLFVIPFVIYAVDGININKIFKTNKIYQAKMFYIIVIFSLSLFVTNFLYDFMHIIK